MQPFENVRVLDLTHVLAGPFCTYQLALLGAEVIKIEPPRDPDTARGRGAAPALNALGMGLNYQVQASNKRALALDLAQPAGAALFRKLVATADVVVENYRVGALAALGLGADELMLVNPRLIHCSITGFGQTGPSGPRNAYDNVIQATSGIMAGTGTLDAPIKTSASMIDYTSGMTAAFAIAAALHQRQLTGAGQAIDCAMLDTAMMLVAPEMSAALYEGDRKHMPREAGLGLYKTKDGNLMLGAFNPRQTRRLWQLLGEPEYARYTDWPQLWEAASDMRARLEALLLERTAAEWEALLAEAGVPAQRVRALDEAARDPQLAAREFIQSVPDLSDPAGSVQVPLAPFRFAHDGARITSPPPRLGQDSDAILGELGTSPDDIARLRAEGVVA